jgi:hypothetical protein
MDEDLRLFIGGATWLTLPGADIGPTPRAHYFISKQIVET